MEEKSKLTKEELKAMSIMGAIGGRAVSKKRGAGYMSKLGKRGAKIRWGKGRSKKTK